MRKKRSSEHSAVEKINAGPLSEKPASEFDAMLTKCHAQADEDSSDHVAMSVILQPVSLAVRMLRQVKSVGATAASLACHARTFLLSRLAPEIVSIRTNGTNTQSRSHTRAKTETHAHVVNVATMAVRPLEEHKACAGYQGRRVFVRRSVQKKILGASVARKGSCFWPVSKGDGRNRVRSDIGDRGSLRLGRHGFSGVVGATFSTAQRSGAS